MDDDLLPARMVNEFVYCPRLFYLEWVEARFAESDDTRYGKSNHARRTRRTRTKKGDPGGEAGSARVNGLALSALSMVPARGLRR